MVAEFYRKAKIKKVTIDKVMSEYHQYFVEDDPILTPKEKEKILKIWVEYAKKNYPAAIFSK